jgi:hypothetical protein
VIHKSYITAIANGIAPIIREFVERESAPLKAQIAELQARPQLKYCGVFEAGRKYAPGEIVTHDGSMWFCHLSTQARPGDGDQWQLAVKRGQNGRDAR